MNTLKYILYKVIPVMLLVSVWVSCKDDEIASLNLSRQFQPGAFDITEGETSTTISWDPSLFTTPGEAEYTLELSKDVDFATVEVSVTTPEVEMTFLDTEIDIRVDYYARVKAKGTDGTNDSNWLISEAFQITGEIFILPIREFDVLVTEALIRWELEEVLTKITLTPQSGTPFDVTISGAEFNAGQKLVGGLTQNTTYTAEVFNADGVSKGFVTFTTKLSYEGFNIIDLTGITGKPKILRDTLQDIPAGSVVWLKRGEIYTIDNTDPTAERLFTKTVTITSAPEANPEFASIHLTTNFNFPAAAVIDSIIFKDLIIRGKRAAGGSFNNDYLINSNASGAMIGVIRLENCKIGALRGTVRVQAGGLGTLVSNYYINNCVIDSIREFAIVMASSASVFTNVEITNSTFSKCRKFVDVRVAGTNSFVINNCTFNNLPSGGVEGAETTYFIDFNSVDCATAISISNCILGKTWNEGVGDFVRGVRAGASTTYNVTNTYTLSDFISTNAAFLIPGVSTYTGSSTSVFTDPTTGDFTIKDGSFPGATNAGDPRWR